MAKQTWNSLLKRLIQIDFPLKTKREYSLLGVAYLNENAPHRHIEVALLGMALFGVGVDFL